MKASALLLIAALSLGAVPAMSQTAAPAGPPPYGAPITVDQARAIVDRGMAAARAGGYRMAFAVVEPSGELVYFARMDDTQYGSIHIAQRKAWTSARYRTTTARMEEATLAGRIVTLANDDAIPLAGGVPIVVDGRIVGALGVSGASAAQDAEIAAQALADG